MLKVWVLPYPPRVCDTDRLRDSDAAESKIFLVSITSSKLERRRVGGTAGGSCTAICSLLSSVCSFELQPPMAPVVKAQHPIMEKLSNYLAINHACDTLTTSGWWLSRVSLSLGYLFASL